jgi:hypothetical protein
MNPGARSVGDGNTSVSLADILSFPFGLTLKAEACCTLVRVVDSVR